MIDNKIILITLSKRLCKNYTDLAYTNDLETFVLEKGTQVYYRKNSYGHHQIWHGGKLINAYGKESRIRKGEILPSIILDSFIQLREYNLMNLSI